MSESRTIFKHYPVTDENCRTTLEKIDELVEGEHFLSGLGSNTIKLVDHGSELVTSQIAHCEHLLMGHVEDPDQPGYNIRPENFVDLTGMMHYSYRNAENPRDKEISALIRSAMGSYSVYMIDKIENVFDRIGFNEVVAEQSPGEEHPEFLYRDNIVNEADAYVFYMIHTAYFGGIEAHPFFNHMYRLFARGGLPCGWSVPLPASVDEVTEANTRANMIMLHFGG